MSRKTIAAGLAVAAATMLAPGAAPASARRFSANVTNPWFPLRPGTVYVYRGVRDGLPARDMLTVTRRTRTIAGARCRVLDDRLYLHGRLAERTTDWYTQDAGGTVWYYGEATATLDPRGRVTSREGSWLAGVSGARPGVFMPAHPRVGRSFRQEYFRGHAEDRFRVMRLDAHIRVPFVSSAHALLTRETTRLEPGAVDEKHYVRGIGVVKEEAVRGGNERLVLVSMTRP